MNQKLFSFSFNQQKKLLNPIVIKRQSFKNQIRKQQRHQKIAELRKLNFQQNYKFIERLVKALPSSIPDLIDLIHLQPEMQATVSKYLIGYIYFNELSSSQIQKQVYRLIKNKKLEQKSQKDLNQELYLFGILFQHEGFYSELLLKKYFTILFQQCKYLKSMNLLVKTIRIIVSNLKLNWIPINEINIIIKYLNQTKTQIENNFFDEEICLYQIIAKNYFIMILDTNQIYQRIRNILQNGSLIVENIKTLSFYKLCQNLTSYPATQYKNQFKNKILSFYESIQKSGLLKILFRNIFFGRMNKLRLACINILCNIIKQLGSQILWKKQKNNPIQNLEQEIRDTKNKIKIIKSLSQLFLTSIQNLQSQQFFNVVVQGQVDSIQLIFYILQTLSNDNDIKKLSFVCLQIILTRSSDKIRKSVANTLQDNKWAVYLQNQCYLQQLIEQALLLIIQSDDFII